MSRQWSLMILDRDRWVPISADLDVGSGHDRGKWEGWKWHEEYDGPDGWEGYVTDDPAVALALIDAMAADKRLPPGWILPPHMGGGWRQEIAELAEKGRRLRFIASAL